jgi:hypothetical protein
MIYLPYLYIQIYPASCSVNFILPSLVFDFIWLHVIDFGVLDVIEMKNVGAIFSLSLP